jgi:hypothetical protein
LKEFSKKVHRCTTMMLVDGSEALVVLNEHALFAIQSERELVKYGAERVHMDPPAASLQEVYAKTNTDALHTAYIRLIVPGIKQQKAITWVRTDIHSKLVFIKQQSSSP